MATFSYEAYQKQQANKKSDGSQRKDGVKVHFMKEFLDKDGDQVVVRFPYKSMSDLVLESVHKVTGIFPNDKYGKNVRCTGDDSCPLCNHENPEFKKRSLKFYAKMIVYRPTETGVELCPTVWEKPSMFVDSDLKSLIDEYGDLSNYLFKINRTGTGNKTRYNIMPVNMNSPIYSPAVYKNDLTSLDGIDPVKILTKSVEQYVEAVNPGSTQKVEDSIPQQTTTTTIEVKDEDDPFSKANSISSTQTVGTVTAEQPQPQVTPTPTPTTNPGVTRYKF